MGPLDNPPMVFYFLPIDAYRLSLTILRENAIKVPSAGVVRSFVVRPSPSEAVVYLENGLTQSHQVLHGHPYWLGLQPHRI